MTLSQTMCPPYKTRQSDAFSKIWVACLFRHVKNCGQKPQANEGEGMLGTRKGITSRETLGTPWLGTRAERLQTPRVSELVLSHAPMCKSFCENPSSEYWISSNQCCLTASKPVRSHVCWVVHRFFSRMPTRISKPSSPLKSPQNQLQSHFWRRAQSSKPSRRRIHICFDLRYPMVTWGVKKWTTNNSISPSVHSSLSFHERFGSWTCCFGQWLWSYSHMPPQPWGDLRIQMTSEYHHGNGSFCFFWH